MTKEWINGKSYEVVKIVNGDKINGNFTLINTFRGNSTTTETITGTAIGIQNKGINDLTVTVNDKDVVVEPDMTIGPDILNFGSFTSVVVTATDAWQLFIYE